MRFGLITIVCLLVLAAIPARAQVESREAIALQNQMAELRRDVAVLREQVGRGGQGQGQSQGIIASVFASRPSGSPGQPNVEITTQLLDRVAAMEESLRRLNGRMDEAENARMRAEADLAKQIADIQFRLDNPAPNAPSAAAAPARPTAKAETPQPPSGSLGTVPAASSVKRTAELALQEGNAALAKQDYKSAEAAAKEVLAAGKSSPRAYDAQFLLAQAVSGQKKPVDAAVAYGDAYNASKQGSHAQDSLVGYAVNLTAIGEKKAACDTLDILRSQFPAPRADIGPKAATARAAAGCR